MLMCLWWRVQEPEDLFETVTQCLMSGADRDALSGWGAIVYVMCEHLPYACTCKYQHQCSILGLPDKHACTCGGPVDCWAAEDAALAICAALCFPSGWPADLCSCWFLCQCESGLCTHRGTEVLKLQVHCASKVLTSRVEAFFLSWKHSVKRENLCILGVSS